MIRFLESSAPLSRLADFHSLAATHREFTADERERIALTRNDIEKLAKALKAKQLATAEAAPTGCPVHHDDGGGSNAGGNDRNSLHRVDELFVCSTCNRTEFYLVTHSPVIGRHGDAELRAWLHGVLAGVRPAAAELIDGMAHRHGEDAALHLFSVAAGLDSVVLGETQILQQLKDAYQVADDTGSTGDVIRPFLHTAFKIGRRTHAETAISTGNVSTASAAVSMATRRFGTLDGVRVLLIGAGSIGRLTVRQLLDAGARDIVVLNRTRARADELAREAPKRVRPGTLDKLSEELATAGVVFSAIACEDGAPIITRRRLLGALPALGESRATGAEEAGGNGDGSSQSPSSSLLVFDLGMPRNVEASVAELAGVDVVTVDELGGDVRSGRDHRQAEVPHVEAIIREEWHKVTDPDVAILRGALEALYRRFSAIALAEVAKARKFGLPESETELASFAARLIKKLLAPVSQSFADPGPLPIEAMQHLQVMVDLFGLRDGAYTKGGKQDTEAIAAEMADRYPLCLDAITSADPDRLNKALEYFTLLEEATNTSSGLDQQDGASTRDSH